MGLTRFTPTFQRMDICFGPLLYPTWSIKKGAYKGRSWTVLISDSQRYFYLMHFKSSHAGTLLHTLGRYIAFDKIIQVSAAEP